MTSITHMTYDVARDGYDPDAWETLNGTPSVAGGRLYLTNAKVIHRGDIQRGSVTFRLNIQRPATENGDLAFGLKSYSNDNYLEFQIQSGVFYVAAKNGTNIAGDEVLWADGVIEEWAGQDTDFKIVWAAGIANFYVNGVKRHTLSGASIPTDTMSYYIENNTSDYLNIASIISSGMQSFYMHTDHADTDTGLNAASAVEETTISEGVVLSLT